MSRGDYGNAWEDYPIKEGKEIWYAEKDGLTHKLMSVDLTKLVAKDRIDTLFKGEKVDVVYSDPPWNPGNMKMFHTLADRDAPYSYNQFMLLYTKLIKKVNPDGLIFLKMGVDYYKTFGLLMEEEGAKTLDVARTIYGNPERPCMLWIGTFNQDLDIDLGKIPDDMRWKECREWVNSFLQEGDNYFDPCTGVGNYLKLAWRNTDWRVETYSTELNKRKLANALKFLANQGYNLTKEEIEYV